jgi:hypothetical protein
MPQRLARRLIILLVLVAALAPLSSGSAERPHPQVSSTSRSCHYAVDEYGNCVEICCEWPSGCVQYFCSGRK